MKPHLLLRVHIDPHVGVAHVLRVLALCEPWKAQGGDVTLLVSGDARARRVGQGRHPLLDERLPCETRDLGESAQAPIPPEVKASAHLALLDQLGLTSQQIADVRPLKVALIEDEGEAHEQADLLFQPYLEGISWADKPVKTFHGRKVRPYETAHGRCRVLRGSAFIVVGPDTVRRRPKREPLQPLAVHKLLVDFGPGGNGTLIHRAISLLEAMVRAGRWAGSCTIVVPDGGMAAPFAGCHVVPTDSALSSRSQDFDAVWCTRGRRHEEALCLGVPAALWAVDEQDHLVTGDLALVNGCYDLGLGSEVDPVTTEAALTQWLGPEGQETRQEQTRDGMRLVDGMGANRVVQELWSLAQDPA